jgi:hypothetical protein
MKSAMIAEVTMAAPMREIKLRDSSRKKERIGFMNSEPVNDVQGRVQVSWRIPSRV